MSTLYETCVEVTGGRAGHARSSDGLLDLDLALPTQLGGDAGRRTRNSCSRQATRPALKGRCATSLRNAS